MGRFAQPCRHARLCGQLARPRLLHPHQCGGKPALPQPGARRSTPPRHRSQPPSSPLLKSPGSRRLTSKTVAARDPWREKGARKKKNEKKLVVNACTPQGEPIFGTGGEKKYVHWFRMQFQISLTSGNKCRNLQKVHSSDDGISVPLTMVPNLCIDKKLGFDSPRCAVSFPRIGIGQMDSKQECFAPSDVQVNLQCAMLISSVAYTHSMTKVAIQLFVRRFGPGRSSDAEFHAIRGTSRCLMAGVTIDRQSFRKRTSSVRIKLFLVQCTVTTSKTNPC